MARVLLLALPDASDPPVGVRVARRAREILADRDGVEVREAPSDAADPLAGAETAILLTSLLDPDRTGGGVRRLDLGDPEAATRVPALPDLAGRSKPRHVWIVGVLAGGAAPDEDVDVAARLAAALAGAATD